MEEGEPRSSIDSWNASSSFWIAACVSCRAYHGVRRSRSRNAPGRTGELIGRMFLAAEPGDARRAAVVALAACAIRGPGLSLEAFLRVVGIRSGGDMVHTKSWRRARGNAGALRDFRM
jgi:hypothetical protein